MTAVRLRWRGYMKEEKEYWLKQAMKYNVNRRGADDIREHAKIGLNKFPEWIIY